MRVISIRNTFNNCPSQIRTLGYSKESQAEITEGKEYEVFAISCWRTVVFLQIINDVGYPSWLPAWLFEVREMLLPSDWICNLFGGELTMIIGPVFVARDETSYNKMVELDAMSVDMFWQRIENI